MIHLSHVMVRLTAIVLTLCTIRVGPLRGQWMWTTDVSTAEDQVQEICEEAITITPSL